VNSLPLATIYEVKIPLRKWKKSLLQRNPAQMTWHIGELFTEFGFEPSQHCMLICGDDVIGKNAESMHRGFRPEEGFLCNVSKLIVLSTRSITLENRFCFLMARQMTL
jgi:hypothetical protein